MKSLRSLAKSCCRRLQCGVDFKRLCSLTGRSCIEMKLANHRTLGRNTGNPRVSPSARFFNLHNIQRAAGASLGKFIQMAWHTIEPHQPYLHNWHISAVCEHLEAVSRRQIKRLIINIPPRSMKSIAVSVMWPAWTWTQRPSERFLYASYSADLSRKHSLDRRTVIRSDWYQRLWGDRFQLSSDQNEKNEFTNSARGVMLATSCGGQATGKGGGILVADDLLNPQQAASEAERLQANSFFDQSLYNRLDNPNEDAIVIVMQRLHEDDVAGHVVGNGNWDQLVIPMEYDGRRMVTSLGWSDPRTQLGELMWPERFSQETVEGYKRTLGAYGYSGQYQQRPSPAEGGLLKRHWWRYWQPANMDLPPVKVKFPDGQTHEIQAKVLPTLIDEKIQSWDCAFKDLETSDYVAGGLWGRAGADKFFLERDCRQMDFPETLRAITSMSAKHPEALAKYVEDKANGPAVIQTLRHSVPGLIAVNPEGGKISRAAAVSPQIESGNVYLPHPAIAPWVEKFIEDCAAFPNAAHDDDVDQMTQALRKLGSGESTRLFPDFSRARHIATHKLKPWWHRWLSLYWDPEQASVLWWCSDEQKRVHVYRELNVAAASAEDLAAEVARQATIEIGGNEQLYLWTFGEYFDRNAASKSVARQIQDGIASVIGHDSAFLWEFTEQERDLDKEQAYASLNNRRQRAARTRIVIQAATRRNQATKENEEVAAWEHLRALIRTEPAYKIPTVEYDKRIAQQILDGNDISKFSEYMQAVDGHSSEPFPKFFVAEDCRITADALLSAARDERDSAELAEGPYFAPLMAVMIGALAHRENRQRPPMEEFVQSRLDRLKTDDSMSRHMATIKAEADYRAAHKVGPIRFQRGRRRR